MINSRSFPCLKKKKEKKNNNQKLQPAHRVLGVRNPVQATSTAFNRRFVGISTVQTTTKLPFFPFGGNRVISELCFGGLVLFFSQSSRMGAAWQHLPRVGSPAPQILAWGGEAGSTQGCPASPRAFLPPAASREPPARQGHGDNTRRIPETSRRFVVQQGAGWREGILWVRHAAPTNSPAISCSGGSPKFPAI